MRIIALFITILLALPAQQAFANQDFEVYQGPVAPLSIRSDEERDLMEVIFEDVLAEQPGRSVEDIYNDIFTKNPMTGRFAGHYAILTDVCGTSSLTCGVLLDIREGHVISDIPRSHAGLDWSKDESLLVVDPFDPEVNEERHLYWGIDRTRFYSWNGQELVSAGQFIWPEVEQKVTGKAYVPPAYEHPPTKFKAVKVKRLDPADLFKTGRVEIPTPTPRPDSTTTGSID